MSLLNNGPHDEQHQTNATKKKMTIEKKKYYDKLSAPFPKPLPNFLFRVKQFDLRTSPLGRSAVRTLIRSYRNSSSEGVHQKKVRFIQKGASTGKMPHHVDGQMVPFGGTLRSLDLKLRSNNENMITKLEIKRLKYN